MVELKAFNNPPVAVKTIFGVVCAILRNTCKDVSWVDCRKDLADPREFVRRCLRVSVKSLSNDCKKMVVNFANNHTGDGVKVSKTLGTCEIYI
jgi:hypothetical protein